jgi:cytochrome P450
MLVTEMDIPKLPIVEEASREERLQVELDTAKEHWLAQGMFGYSVLRYEDAQAVLRDKRWQSAVGLITKIAGVEMPEGAPGTRTSILNAEGDVHLRLRRLVAPAFTPRTADRFRPVMRDVVNSLINNFCERGEADAVADLCEPYPIPIICELLGAPKQDWQKFSVWATDILRIFNFNLAEDMPKIIAAQTELEAYSISLIEARRNKPADDLLTNLIAAEESGDKLDTDELVMMVNAVIVGGTDTTRNQLGMALSLFAEHPKQWDRLARDPSLASSAVEEVMRYAGAVRGTGRFASEDIEYKGVLFPAGTLMFPALAASNRDGLIFDEPEKFDITREPTSTSHMTFGSGIHYCLGAPLARAELQEAFVILSQRLRNLRINGPVHFKTAGAGIFGPDSLPIAFDAHAPKALTVN